VRYGDDPEEYLEPANLSPFEDILGMTGPILPQENASAMARVVGYKIITGRLCDVHAFDEYDAAACGYTDVPGRIPTGF
jgi:hypothetical protein